MLTTILLILVVLLAVAVLASRRPSPPSQVEDISAEEVVQAAVELHAIHRRFDVAWTNHELRRDSAQLRRELAEEMDSPEQSDG